MRPVLGAVLKAFEADGFCVAYSTVCVHNVGGIQSRKRWFALAVRKQDAHMVHELQERLQANRWPERAKKACSASWNASEKPPLHKWLLPQKSKDDTARLVMLGNAARLLVASNI